MPTPKKEIKLSIPEVAWILQQLSIHFLIKECREVSRYLSAKATEGESEAKKEDSVAQ